MMLCKKVNAFIHKCFICSMNKGDNMSRTAVVSFCLMVLLCGISFAQETTATISGTVTDES